MKNLKMSEMLGAFRISLGKYLNYKQDSKGNYYLSLDGENYYLIEPQALRFLADNFKAWSKEGK